MADSTQTNFQQLADSTQNNFRQLLGEIREMKDDSVHTAFSLPSSTQNHSLMSNAKSSEARIKTPIDRSHVPVGFTSLAHCPSAVPSFGFSRSRMPITSTLRATNTALEVGGGLTTEVTNSHENHPLAIRDTDSHSHLSNTCTVDVQKSATSNLSENTCSKHQHVCLPAFAGNSNDSWKVWHARFTTIANLNKWDETTRLSELMQRLQGTVAEFVFDEILEEM